jgi:hypothetical protein
LQCIAAPNSVTTRAKAAGSKSSGAHARSAVEYL